MKLALINPDARSDLMGFSFYRVRPLVLPHLAGLVQPGVKIELKEAAFQTIEEDPSYDLVGITVLTVYRTRAYQIAARFRGKGVRVVLGGPHPTMFPEEALEHADSVVIGEAEDVMESVLMDATCGGLKRMYHSEHLHSLAGLPSPRYDLSWTAKAGRKWAIAVQATRGCIFGCEYCYVPILFKKTYRKRPVEDVVRNIEDAFQQIGRRPIVFTDENLFTDRGYAKQLLNALIPLKLRWSGQATMMSADDPELLSLIKASGGSCLQIGMESINKESLKEVKKHHNRVDRYPDQLKAFRAHGLTPMVNVMFGFDHDDPDIFLKTAKFLTRNKVPFIIPFIIRPLKGTPLYARLKKEGRLHGDVDDYDKWGERVDVVTYRPLRMTEEQLLQGRRIFVVHLAGLNSIFRRLLMPPGRHFWKMLLINLIFNIVLIQKPRIKRLINHINFPFLRFPAKSTGNGCT